ncbi:OLC1v1032765C1 [Oldenlandia corymbosa var. corymbosa]|uniref:OLC1v1032765C1 n=1 Tax=Oldenlandia corymbosa var. corymbosa TaxID=529605 RepID=A0AAV1CPP2_OLDCO|nr:OLC1v1032765C1 [Oldenlandia corymbosa var. corymbosa]
MALRNIQNKDSGGLVLSSDAKPRLKWTPELHQRGNTQIINESDGHSWSHSVPSQEPLTEDDGESQMISPFIAEISDGTQNTIHESTQIANALQMQMEVQRKLYEQIEVQRHLQLRIEAQGKYLQSVLQKAQETLAGYNSSPMGVELAKAELSQLVSMVEMGYPNSSASGVTEIAGSMLKELENKQQTVNGCSVESSLTSSESSGRKEMSQHLLAHDESDEADKQSRNSVVLPLMEMQPGQSGGSDNGANDRKRNCGNIGVEKPLAKRLNSHKNDEQVPRKFGLLETLDLNSKYLNDFDSGPAKTLDLNCQGVDYHPNGYN